MKTRTTFRKAAIRSAAVVVSFVLISFTVSAQEFWVKVLTNSSFNEIAVAMVESSTRGSQAENLPEGGASWNSFDMAFDPALELEGWMSDEAHFRGAGFQNESNNGELAVKKTESLNLDCHADECGALAVEGWMVEDALWVR